MAEHPYSECKQHGEIFRTRKGCSQCADEAEIADLRAKLERAEAALQELADPNRWKMSAHQLPHKVAQEELAAIRQSPPADNLDGLERWILDVLGDGKEWTHQRLHTHLMNQVDTRVLALLDLSLLRKTPNWGFQLVSSGSDVAVPDAKSSEDDDSIGCDTRGGGAMVDEVRRVVKTLKGETP